MEHPHPELRPRPPRQAGERQTIGEQWRSYSTEPAPIRWTKRGSMIIGGLMFAGCVGGIVVLLVRWAIGLFLAGWEATGW
jgi:hypothetical protein